MKKYLLRPATANDLEFVRRLHHETLREYIEQIWGWNESLQDSSVEKWFKPQDIKIVQSFDGKDIGLLVVKNRGSDIFLESISITKNLQRKGLGTIIISDVISQANVQGLSVSLQILKPNPAKALYERLGFRVVSENSTHFQMVYQLNFE